MRIKIKKLHEDAVVPKYGTPGAAGFDLVAIEDVYIKPGETKLVKTGLAIAVPDGYEMQIRPRSGLSLKTTLRVANSPGTVDSDFRGEVCVIAHNAASPYGNQGGDLNVIFIAKGDRIAQGVICPVVKAEFEVVESLDETQRGEGGYGSTGR
jgi:dUTP pyrophosphatase